MLPPFWDYRREYDELRDEILAAVDRVFRSGRLILGQEGIKFERAMAAYLGVADGVGVNSGTDAIYIALAAVGVNAGDEVITVPNTAVPTVSAIRTLGARPVFVDVRDDDFLMDVEQVEAAITPRTTAIIPVHLYGQCVDLDPLMAIAQRHGLKVMEDCAQSQGALYKNHQSGSVGDAASFLVLSDQGARRLWRRRHGDEQRRGGHPPGAQSLRFYGMETDYYSERHGYNSRLDEVQAAILVAEAAAGSTTGSSAGGRSPRATDRGLAGSGLVLPRENAHSRHTYYVFVVETCHRSRRRAGAARQARHQLQCFLPLADPSDARHVPISAIAKGNSRWRNARRSDIFSLPMYPHLKDEEVDDRDRSA